MENRTPYCSEMKKNHIERIYGGKFIPDNRVTVFYEGKEAFRDIFSEIERAADTICLIFYIYRNDDTGRELGELLVRKAGAGVRVCILYDHFGSVMTPGSFWKDMRDAGIEIRASRPFRWNAMRRYIYRDHRKLIVIDGKVAYTGGLNIADEYRGYGLLKSRKKGWRDTAVKVEGPAAASLFRIFDETWRFWKGPPLEPLSPEHSISYPGGPRVMPIFSSSARGRKKMRRLLHWCIRRATKQICLTTAYFTPSRRMLHILSEAVKRGVRVKLLLPSKSDVVAAQYAGRAFYAGLLKAGVEIYLYQPAILHAKAYAFDGTFAIVGSANLDFRSLRRNDEGNIGVYDKVFAGQMEMIFNRDCDYSAKLELETWNRRPLCRKLEEKFFALFRRRL